MKPIDFFRLQAKNLHKDFKTQTPALPSDDSINHYDTTYFDVDGIVIDFDLDEDKLTLMKAQHIIALLAGFNKWNDLISASETELELAKLLFDNMHKISAEEWQWYLISNERDSNMTFDSEIKLEIFKKVFAEVDGHQSDRPDYRLR